MGKRLILRPDGASAVEDMTPAEAAAFEAERSRARPERVDPIPPETQALLDLLEIQPAEYRAALAEVRSRGGPPR